MPRLVDFLGEVPGFRAFLEAAAASPGRLLAPSFAHPVLTAGVLASPPWETGSVLVVAANPDAAEDLARELTLFLPTRRNEKFKAKQVIDCFVVRAGDVLSAGTVYLGTAVFTLSISQFAWINVGVVVVWLGVSIAAGREFQRRVSSHDRRGRSRDPVPEAARA